MEGGEVGVLGEAGCSPDKRDQKAQSKSSDVGDVEVVRIIHPAAFGDKEAENWKKLHVGGLDGISCQHLQVMMTKNNDECDTKNNGNGRRKGILR